MMFTIGLLRMNKKSYSVYYSCESRISSLFLNIKGIYFAIILDVVFSALSEWVSNSNSKSLLRQLLSKEGGIGLFTINVIISTRITK